MRKVLIALGATAVALGGVLSAEAQTTTAAGSGEAKAKYVSKCKAPEKWNAVEGKCEKVAAKSKAKAPVKKKTAAKAAPKAEAAKAAPKTEPVKADAKADAKAAPKTDTKAPAAPAK